MRKIYIPITRPETIFTLILDHQDLRGWYRKNWNCSGLLCYKLKDIPNTYDKGLNSYNKKE